MARHTPEEKVRRADAKIRRVQQELAKAKSDRQRAMHENREQERKADTRRKLLVGELVMKRLDYIEAQGGSQGQEWRCWYQDLLNRGLAQASDRALFGLPPLPEQLVGETGAPADVARTGRTEPEDEMSAEEKSCKIGAVEVPDVVGRADPLPASGRSVVSGSGVEGVSDTTAVSEGGRRHHAELEKWLARFYAHLATRGILMDAAQRESNRDTVRADPEGWLRRDPVVEADRIAAIAIASATSQGGG